MTAVATGPLAPASRSGSGQTLTGTATLLRFTLRRERIRIGIWVASVGLIFIYAATVLGTTYPTAADRRSRADLIGSPAGIMLSGPGYGTEQYTLGAMIANEMVLTVVVAIAIMNIGLIVRLTRGEEESGRAELVRAGVVGRHAPLTSALLSAAVADAAFAVVSTGALVAAGLGATDSLAVGVGLALTGLVFAAIAAAAAQVAEHARTASGLALAALGAAFLLRAIGDVAAPHGSAASWFSPIAWAQQTRPFVGLRWWPLLLSVAAVVVVGAGAYALAARRDLGAGLVNPRPGTADAATHLRGPLALGIRLQRGQLAAWGIGVFVMALACGSFTGSITDSLENNEAVSKVFDELGGDATNAFLSIMLLMFAVTVGAYAVASLLRLRADEASGHTELVLSTAVDRWRWMGAALLIAMAGATVLLVLAGVGLALTATSDGQVSRLGPLVGGALSYLPAVGVLVGLGAALYGVVPRRGGLVWLPVIFTIVVGLFGTLLDLPAAVLALSPYEATPAVPMEAFDLVPLLGLLGVAAVLAAVGLIGFRRRDVVSS